MYPGVNADGSATFGVAFASQGDFYDLPLITRDDDDLRSWFSRCCEHHLCGFIDALGRLVCQEVCGDSGDDQDFFTLTIEGLDATGSRWECDVFLADHRFDNSLDYILDDWICVDLGPVSSARSLSFSRVPRMWCFWHEHPSYFAVDDIVMLTPVVALDIRHVSARERW